MLDYLPNSRVTDYCPTRVYMYISEVPEKIEVCISGFPGTYFMSGKDFQVGQKKLIWTTFLRIMRVPI